MSNPSTREAPSRRASEGGGVVTHDLTRPNGGAAGRSVELAISDDSALSLAKAWADRPHSTEGATEWYTEALKRWLKSSMSPLTVTSYTRTVRTFFAWASHRVGSIVAPHEIRESDVDAWVRALLEGERQVYPDMLSNPLESFVVSAIERSPRPLDYRGLVEALERAGADAAITSDPSAVGKLVADMARKKYLRRIVPPEVLVTWPVDVQVCTFTKMPKGPTPAPATITQRLAALGSFFSAMRGSEGRIPGLPFSSPVGASPVDALHKTWAAKASRESAERRYARQTRPEDMHLLETAVREAPGVSEVTRARDWALISLLFQGGFRISEVLQATNRDLSVDGRLPDGSPKHVLTVRRKRGKVQGIALEPEAVAAVENYRAALELSGLMPETRAAAKRPDAPLIAAVGRRGWTLDEAIAHVSREGRSAAEQIVLPMTRNAVFALFLKYVDAIAGQDAELRTKLRKRLHAHGLRHLNASIWAKLVPLHVLQQRLGHASITTTEKYMPEVNTRDLDDPGRPRAAVTAAAVAAGWKASPAPAQSSTEPGTAPDDSTDAPADTGVHVDPLVTHIAIPGSRKPRDMTARRTPADAPPASTAGASTAVQGQAQAQAQARRPESTLIPIPPRRRIIDVASPSPPRPPVVARAPAGPPVIAFGDAAHAHRHAHARGPSAPARAADAHRVPIDTPDAHVPVHGTAPPAPVIPRDAPPTASTRDVAQAAIARAPFPSAPVWAYRSIPLATDDLSVPNGMDGEHRGASFREASLKTGNHTLLPYRFLPGTSTWAKLRVPIPCIDPDVVEVRDEDPQKPVWSAMQALEAACTLEYDEWIETSPTAAMALVTWVVHLLSLGQTLAGAMMDTSKSWIAFDEDVRPPHPSETARAYRDAIVSRTVRAHSTTGIMEWLRTHGSTWSPSDGMGPRTNRYEIAFEREAMALSVAHRSDAKWAALEVFDPPAWMLLTDDPIGDPAHGVRELAAFRAWADVVLAQSVNVFISHQGKPQGRILAQGDEQAFASHPNLLNVLRVLQANYADAQEALGILKREGRDAFKRTAWGDAQTQGVVKDVCRSLSDPSRGNNPFDPTKYAPSRWRAVALSCAGVTDVEQNGSLASRLFESDEQDTIDVFARIRWDERLHTYCTDAPFRASFQRAHGFNPQLCARRALRVLWERHLYMRGAATKAKVNPESAERCGSALALQLAILVPSTSGLEQIVADAIRSRPEGWQRPGEADLRRGWERARAYVLARVSNERSLVRATEESVRAHGAIDPRTLEVLQEMHSASRLPAKSRAKREGFEPNRQGPATEVVARVFAEEIDLEIVARVVNNPIAVAFAEFVSCSQTWNG